MHVFATVYVRSLQCGSSHAWLALCNLARGILVNKLIVSCGHIGAVFGPLFHELIPNANFNKKAKLSTIVKLLNIVRISYPLWKADLKSALKQAKAKNVDAVAISHFRDLTKLMGLFIPAVSAVKPD